MPGKQQWVATASAAADALATPLTTEQPAAPAPSEAVAPAVAAAPSDAPPSAEQPAAPLRGEGPPRLADDLELIGEFADSGFKQPPFIARRGDGQVVQMPELLYRLAEQIEPPEWQPRATWAGARLLCGAAAFFFISFVFAYFYLRSQDPNRGWKIGKVDPSAGLGVVILGVLIASALSMWYAANRPQRAVSAGAIALALALMSVVLQVIQWTTLGFGPGSGGYASVYVGWTAFYAVMTLISCYWIETQVATAWRRGRETAAATPADVLTDTAVTAAALEACSFFWSFMVANGLVLFVVLYVL